MKLLTSVLLASASVMASGEMGDDMGLGHGNEVEEPVPPSEIEVESSEETTTPFYVVDRNVTVVHITQSTIDHTTGTTSDPRTTAQTTAEPYTFQPIDHPTDRPIIDNKCHHENEEPKCGCNAEEMALWKIEMEQWKINEASKFLIPVRYARS